MAEKEKIAILRVGDKYYSGRTGAQFKKPPFRVVDGVVYANAGYVYNPFPQNMKVIEGIKASRRRASGRQFWTAMGAKGEIYVNADGQPIKAVDGYIDRGYMSAEELAEKRKKYRNAKHAAYLNTFGEEVPINQMGIPVRKRSTYNIANTRDAVLRAVNKTVATSMGIPLNKLNRPVVNAIYAKEIGEAARKAPGLFEETVEKGAFKGVIKPRGLKHYPHIIANPETLNRYHRRTQDINYGELEAYGISVPNVFEPYTKGWANDQVAAHSGVIGVKPRKPRKDGTPRKPRKDMGVKRGPKRPKGPKPGSYLVEVPALAPAGKIFDI